MKKEEQSENKKITLKERLKNKRERAKIELMLYGIFFIGVIIFARVIGNSTNITENNINNSIESESFILSIKDNYEYNIQVTLNNIIYEYYGKVLGNNSTINLKIDGKEKSYYLMNKKYYTLENGNYLLTDEEEVYTYINQRYLNIKNIKEYLNIAIKENSTYKVKISDIVLNSKSEEYITINIEEGDKNIVIDYTPLLKLTDNNIEKAIVNITYNNIDQIISLDE